MEHILRCRRRKESTWILDDQHIECNIFARQLVSEGTFVLSCSLELDPLLLLLYSRSTTTSQSITHTR